MSRRIGIGPPMDTRNTSGGKVRLRDWERDCKSIDNDCLLSRK